MMMGSKIAKLSHSDPTEITVLTSFLVFTGMADTIMTWVLIYRCRLINNAVDYYHHVAEPLRSVSGVTAMTIARRIYIGIALVFLSVNF